jgi:tetratricopeptide (TPR) repeat protein
MNRVLAVLLVVLAMACPLQSYASAGATPKMEYPEIVALLKAENFDAALTAANKATLENPNSAKAFHLLGRTQFYREQDEAAIAAFSKAIALDPALSDAWFFRGLVYRFGNKTDLARPNFEKAVALEPNDEKYWFELGALEHSAKRNKAAGAALEKAAALNQKRAETWFLLGLLAEENAEHAKAAELMGKALAINPDFVSANWNFAMHHQLRGDAKLAVKHYLAVLKQKPDDHEALKHIVQSYYRLEDFDNAQLYRAAFLEAQAKSVIPAIREMKEFCFDQFDAPGGRILAYETIDKSGHFFYWLTFKLVDVEGKVIKTINLETSDFLKEDGMLFLLGSTKGRTHTNYGINFAKMPPYPELKKLVLQANLDQLKTAATSTK